MDVLNAMLGVLAVIVLVVAILLWKVPRAK
jgi:hypothetical protein